ncbi:MAG: TIGR02147 family protein [Oligoflexia bacterium]|nr:TIGR02147 family protein [Oligoflexia bacterium]
MEISVFDHEHYQDYLVSLLLKSEHSRGNASRLARFLGCQSSFISQVLSGRAHLSLEHAIRVSDFLNHTADERHYFMLLVQGDRAGSEKLRHYYRAQTQAIRDRRRLVRERIRVHEDLKPEHQMIYYSVWWYLAIHILVALPGTQTREQLAKRLNLAPEIVERALSFLTESGLIVEKAGKYSIGAKRIHLGPESPMLPRHHANWRNKALQAIDEMKPENLHYSGVIGISRADAKKLRAMMLDLLQRTEPIVRDSPEEAPYVMLLDFFEL